MKNICLDLLFGVAVGDALGVPYEFSSREEMQANPAKDMVGYKVHNQAPGTWSDDSSLTFCLAEAMTSGYDLKKAAVNFIKWRDQNYWTARGTVFDIGITTTKSISELAKILIENREEDLKLLKCQAKEGDNGNGSLMRILPLIFEIKGKGLQQQFDIVWENSALTHKHIRAAFSCLIYLKFAENLWDGLNKTEAYMMVKKDIQNFWEEIGFADSERVHFKRIIEQDISKAEEKTIMSGGYVIESLEASFWTILNTNNYEEAVLKSINFGHDTDTTAAITGGLAGIYYSAESIPQYWKLSLARMEDIIDLAGRLNQKYFPE